jgi:alpha-D-xyloside xylohydrolase
MEQSLRGGLSLALSGFGFWSHDIGGFENTSTADVYKRWCAFGLLSTHSRLHGSTSYRIPWAYDEEAVEVLRFFARLQKSLMPYLYAQAVETAQTGVPMMRAMVLEFPEDRACEYLDKQYMLGDSLLVAPIFNDEGRGEYYLPKGTWTHLLTGAVNEGERFYTEKFDYLSLPLFVKENSIIITGDNDERPDYDFSAHPLISIYALQEGCCATATIYVDKLSVLAENRGGSLFIKINAEGAYRVRLVNFRASRASVDFTQDGDDTLFALNGKAELTVEQKQ